MAFISNITPLCIMVCATKSKVYFESRILVDNLLVEAEIIFQIWTLLALYCPSDVFLLAIPSFVFRD